MLHPVFGDRCSRLPAPPPPPRFDGWLEVAQFMVQKAETAKIISPLGKWLSLPPLIVQPATREAEAKSTPDGSEYLKMAYLL